MSLLTAEIGRTGEDYACDKVVSWGWLIISRNWRTRRGEIDIIALDRDTLVFIEVKTWPRGQFEDLELVIGRNKQKRMVETAKCFLAENREYNSKYIRFDVIMVSDDPLSLAEPAINHLKDAFSERV